MNTKEYTLHLLAEISNFLLDSDPDRLVISLHREAEGLHLCALDSTVRSDEELAAVNRALNTEARPEMAEYYGHMAGSDLIGHARLNLIGWQVRKAEAGRSDTGTKIDLWLSAPSKEPALFSLKRRKKNEDRG